MKKMFVLLWPLWVGAGLVWIIYWALDPTLWPQAQPTPARSTGYNVVVISGCEYIEHGRWGEFLIHKANCTNLIHGHE